jgi:hypothetical protein
MQYATFDYLDHELDAIERALSPERFKGYLDRADGDRRKAITLHEKNTALSESLYGTIQGLEVPLRNAIHDLLSPAFGCAWFDAPGILHHPQNKMVVGARQKIDMSNHLILTPGRVVAELSFGFWTGLVGKQYDQTLWVPHLHRAFPHARAVTTSPSGEKKIHKLKRSAVADRLDSIRRLRNRIAHHEPILDVDAALRYQEIVETIGWICPITASWVDYTASFGGK